jgi:hypothetical protein
MGNEENAAPDLESIMWDGIGLVAVMIPLAGMIVPALVIVFALERLYRIRKLDHEAKLRAIEKGYDVPMKRPSARYPFAWPLVLLGFGLALILIYVMEHNVDPEALGFGLVLFFIGAGLFASRFIGVKRTEDEVQTRNNIDPLWRAPEPASAPAVSTTTPDTTDPPTTGSAS